MLGIIAEDRHAKSGDASWNRGHLAPLTGIRFFLATWVIAYHQTWPAGQLGAVMAELNWAVFALLRTGYMAVGMFFVLSGFVLAYSYPAEKLVGAKQLSRYLLTRFARIYPIYLFGLLVMAPVVLHRATLFGYASDSGRELFTFPAHLILIQAWWPRTAVEWNGPGWSLSAELFFYACFPLIVPILSKLREWPFIGLTMIGLWSASLMCPLFVIWLGSPGFSDVSGTSVYPDANRWVADFVKCFPILRIAEFTMGVVSLRIYRNLSEGFLFFRGKGWLLYGPSMLCLLLAIVVADRIPFPLLHNGLTAPLCCTMLIGLSVGGGPVASLLSRPVFQLLGAASYSMYILHFPIYLAFGSGAKVLLGARPAGVSTFVVYYLIVVLVAIVAYRCVEAPLYEILKKGSKSRTATLFA